LLQERRIRWAEDGEAVRALLGTTWKGHPILKKDYFQWQFLDKPDGEAIGYCAEESNRKNFFAGVYIVLPTLLRIDDAGLPFSTSLYTMTHPDYYKQGIFFRLARLTYSECSKRGIAGTIGVPNGNSLHGFTKGLDFQAIGKFVVLARLSSILPSTDCPLQIREVVSEKELGALDFALNDAKARAGGVLTDHSRAFLAWRFFRCPGIKYRVLVAVDRHNAVKGMIVLRFTRKRGVPVTVIVNFIVDYSLPDAELIGRALLAHANRSALRRIRPILITLVNPFSYEAALLGRSGFRPMPASLLPHESHFIVKAHEELGEGIASKLFRFENWHFSFADYDIF
jgi:GNAT superfamily N-acetyltransferase